MVSKIIFQKIFYKYVNILNKVINFKTLLNIYIYKIKKNDNKNDNKLNKFSLKSCYKCYCINQYDKKLKLTSFCCTGLLFSSGELKYII